MNMDYGSTTGRSHHISEDYVYGGVDSKEQPYVVLADGCSGAPDTDFGSRLLVKSAETMLRRAGEVPEARFYHTRTATSALGVAVGLELNSMSCDATLLTAKVVGDNFFIYICGDGAVALKPKNEPYVVHVINYKLDDPDMVGKMDNLQGYPSYLARQGRLHGFLEYPNSKYSTLYVERPKELLLEQREETKCSDKLIETFGGRVEDFEWVAIMSDGVESFYTISDMGVKNPVSLMHIIPHLLKFPNRRGEFVQRRFNRFIKEAQKTGWINDDDVSVGVLNFA
jgi:hypothetical protein